MKKRPPSQSIEWLIKVIENLPSDEPVPEGTLGYNCYNTQKDHWLGWLNPSAGTGTYPRKTSSDRDARDIYNRIVEPKLLIWLISAAKVQTPLIQSALSAADNASSLASKSAAIRRHVPWQTVEDSLNQSTY